MAAPSIPLASLESNGIPDLSLRIDRHRCRFCGCTEDTPCAIAIRKDREGNYLLDFARKMTVLMASCSWYIPGVCSNPGCIEKLIRESR